MAEITNKVSVLKADGNREIFDEEKLRASLLHSGASEKSAENVISHILSELHDEITTGEIYRHAFSVLQNISKPVARSYSLRRAIMDLGPSGFPFEDFIAEVLKAKGFKCETRQTVLGVCVPHEVDVVAYNDSKLIMIEVKFHNELGTKSDLKVVLYIKARFDDLAGNVFKYGGVDRRITDSWLITNTKFSSTAIHYGVCNNMTMIGWNYPEKGNLQDMVEEEGLHPITCLSSLSAGDKKMLLEKRVVLCSTIKKDHNLLSEILGGGFDITPVINEINEL
ncbi:MAG: ATPase [Candidatus Zambryskibacteria bacterium CG_4_9_14_3_um_filter_42_9]|uniref:ATPase n=1 Tax=Candidatus Zambryskibacteria bacterium CG22_combo_CG10-13_8_21_14_all_42_17 TaxID=1975118 RepID=A0A2H0BDF0_9BACT|nr:MAG: ATPase [Candidatus Zambryskibacteria bacterium CG22_combo_CG10-13_8_21_14_all_42_17]PJA36648.1 MAG: ATPase [Candidatus Zambryskibacteria bacterium CG_4_9_14_3_um_filter_42_9]